MSVQCECAGAARDRNSTPMRCTSFFGRTTSCLAGCRRLSDDVPKNGCQIRPTLISVRDGCGSARGWCSFAAHAGGDGRNWPCCTRGAHRNN
jgi:hypothetical protein